MSVSISRNTLILAFVAACGLAFALQGHILWKPMLITDDIVQHHVWLDGGVGSGFQPDDPWISAAKAIQPYVTAAVFQAVRQVLPTLLVGKVIALVLLALTGFLVFRIGACLGGVRLGWITLGLFFVSDAWIGFSGGFARSFAWPLVCGFLLALLTRRAWLAALCLFLAAALYPIVFVLLSPVYAVAWLADEAREGWRQTFNVRAQLRAQWPLLLAVAAGSTLVLLKSRELGMHPFVGPQVTLGQIQTDPLYGTGGRVPLWPPVPLRVMLPWTLLPWEKAVLEPVFRHAAALPKGVDSLVPVALQVMAVAVVISALWLVWRRSREKCTLLLALAGSGVVTFWIAEFLLPRLFESSRYLGWSMPVLAVLSWAVVLEATIGLLRPGRGRELVLAVLALVLLSRVTAIRGKGAEDMSGLAPLYAALARTGGEEMIACFPRTGDLIPVLCHRSVYVSHEASHAVLFSRYRALVMERHASQLKAFYSAWKADVRAFCIEKNISWLVVEEKYYRADMESGVHFAPFEQQMRDMLKETPEPWLLTYARKSGRQVQPGIYLLNTGPIIDSSSDKL